jgi:hypothetical protein
VYVLGQVSPDNCRDEGMNASSTMARLSCCGKAINTILSNVYHIKIMMFKWSLLPWLQIACTSVKEDLTAQT